MVKSRILSMLAMFAVVLAATTFTWACDEGAARPDRGAGMAERVAALELEEELQVQVLELLEEHHAAMAAMREEGAEVRESLRERFAAAAEADDTEAIEALRAEMGEMFAAHRESMEAFKADLAELLTEEQLAELMPARGHHGMRGRRGHRGMRGGCEGGMRGGMGRCDQIADELGMTDEQKEAAKAIFEEVMADCDEEASLADKKALFESAMQRVYDEVLTEEQQAQADEMRERFEASDVGRLMDLDEDQLALAETIKAEVMAAMEAAETGEEKMAIMRAGFQRFRDEVLTEEQQEAFDSLSERFQGGGRCGSRGGDAETSASHCGSEEDADETVEETDVPTLD